MNVNLLAISVGNSRTRAGVFVHEKLVHTLAVANDQLDAALDEAIEQAQMEHLRGLNPVGFLLASVNPPVAQKVQAILTRHTDQPVLRVERDVPAAIGRQLDPQTGIGEDRLLAAAGAYDVLQQACVVIDAGTAITIDFVDGQGTFHGGAIAPGTGMMLAALHERTAQIPPVELARPHEPIGHNTAHAVLSGVFHALRGMARELTEQYAHAAGAYPIVIATGGDAQLLFEGYELVERIVPDLVLRGMAVSYRHHIGADTPPAPARRAS